MASYNDCLSANSIFVDNCILVIAYTAMSNRRRRTSEA